MTTIAYKDGVIAYDSRRSSGTTIVDDDYEKCHVHQDVRFWFTGCVSDIEDFIAIWFGAEHRKNVDCTALVYDGRLWLSGVANESGMWREPLPVDKPYAMGSGSDHAWTAMDCGASAAQAVRMAMKRDSGTGGQIRTFKIGE